MGIKSNIWKYCFLMIFTKQMIVPIFVIFLLFKGLNPIQIGSILSLGTIIGLALELPSGFISDNIGHKFAITIAFLLQSIAMLFYAIGSNFWWFLIGRALYVAGTSFWSGTGSAFLFETLKNLDRENEYEKLQGRATAISQPTSAIFLIVVPFLYAYNKSSAFYLNFVFLVLCFFLTLTLKQPQFYKSVGSGNGLPKVFGDIKRVWKYITQHKMFTSLMLLFSVNDAIQDSIDNFGQVYFNFIGIPQQLFGFIYASNRILQGVGSSFAHKARQKLTEFSTALGLTGVLVIFSITASIIRQWFGIFTFLIRNFFEGLFDPIEAGFLNKEITQGDRISLLSVSNLVAGLIKAVATFSLGILFDKLSVPNTFLITTTIVLITMSALTISVKRTRHIST